MKRLILWLLLTAGLAQAQTLEVNPADLDLTVTIENADVTPFQGEMVLLTIHGVYRRHITREKLIQPGLDGFNWMQLGQDHWYETQVRGKKVKNFKRRMALFPEQAGELTIGPFVHHLTLTDEGDDWFEHDIQSEPLTITVDPAPQMEGWWFPVRRLEISDQWSNAPDQLGEGEGVLRVIRITAVGASPDMIPPMPELASPSAMIFPHPEQRLVELSPQGPVSIAFWRWTIRPGRSRSAILEPLTFDYFDTTTRQAHSATITAQRVAMDETSLPDPVLPPAPTRQRPTLMASTGVIAFAAGLSVLLLGRNFSGLARLHALPAFNPLYRQLRRAARHGDLAATRRAASAILQEAGPCPQAARLLHQFDNAVFGSDAQRPDTSRFAREFLTSTTSRSRTGSG
ncbi:hypothetical protein [Sedimentitalea todarodis]|uniref:Protein BatD n=1 Tax=Sedimentitalea todarodis TaxID=1631240 RepID=A0ABU3VHX3_9RHOB|nr:hypothetical protein [Sedimentitalea todarodis]MDU9005778.1 hypothetical protein [Sedimentitalea todarodis]